MKKIFTLALLSAFAFTMNAQTQVTFRVDMTGQTVDPTGLHVAGDFQSWTPSNDAYKMEQVGTSNIYTLTTGVAAGVHEFKYVNGNAWQIGGAEASEQKVTGECGNPTNFGNRKVTVPDQASFTTPTWKWDSCDETKVATNDLTSTGKVTVAPMPVSDEMTIRFENVTAAHTLTLTTVTGQVVRQIENVRDSRVTINCEHLLAGAYFLTIRNSQGEQMTKKIMVR
jgi:Secretion system C-terminal sorting domain